MSDEPANGSRIDWARYVDARMADHLKLHASEHRALDAAEAAMAVRLEGMNEFREQLTQQTRDFVSREALEAAVRERNVRIDNLEQKLETLASSAQRAAIAAGIASGFIGLIAGTVLIRLQVFT